MRARHGRARGRLSAAGRLPAAGATRPATGATGAAPNERRRTRPTPPPPPPDARAKRSPGRVWRAALRARPPHAHAARGVRTRLRPNAARPADVRPAARAPRKRHPAPASSARPAPPTPSQGRLNTTRRGEAQRVATARAARRGAGRRGIKRRAVDAGAPQLCRHESASGASSARPTHPQPTSSPSFLPGRCAAAERRRAEGASRLLAAHEPKNYKRHCQSECLSRSRFFGKEVASGLRCLRSPTKLAHGARVRAIKDCFEPWRPLEG